MKPREQINGRTWLEAVPVEWDAGQASLRESSCESDPGCKLQAVVWMDWSKKREKMVLTGYVVAAKVGGAS